MAAAPERPKRRRRLEDLEDLEDGELPKGFFRSEVLKNRHDPKIANRTLHDPEQD